MYKSAWSQLINRNVSNLEVICMGEGDLLAPVSAYTKLAFRPASPRIQQTGWLSFRISSDISAYVNSILYVPFYLIECQCMLFKSHSSLRLRSALLIHSILSLLLLSLSLKKALELHSMKSAVGTYVYEFNHRTRWAITNPPHIHARHVRAARYETWMRSQSQRNRTTRHRHLVHAQPLTRTARYDTGSRAPDSSNNNNDNKLKTTAFNSIWISINDCG